jgi:phage shock protein B
MLELIRSGELIPYMLFGIPIIWIVAHYFVSVMRMRHNERKAEIWARAAGTEEDATGFQKVAERLEKRMKSLESILDTEAPGWRRKYDD